MEMNFDRSPLSTSIYLTKLNNQGIYLLIILLYYTTSILLHLASFECTVKLKKCVHGAAALRFDRFLSANIYMDKSEIRHAYKRRKIKKY